MAARWSLLAVFVAATFVYGEGPLIHRDCIKTTCPPSRYCCPDDYCARPMPKACPAAKGCCDDYDRKPLPNVACSPKSCEKDDYCPKWFPKCLPPSLQPWFVCK